MHWIQTAIKKACNTKQNKATAAVEFILLKFTDYSLTLKLKNTKTIESHSSQLLHR